jgi:hypothetical protein
MYIYVSGDLSGKTVITTTMNLEKLAFLQACGIRKVIATTLGYPGRTFGTNRVTANLTAYA